MKVKERSLTIITLLVISSIAAGQDSLLFSGQLSSWLNASLDNELPLWGGVRYIPQLNYGLPAYKSGRFDTELSLNIYGNAGLRPFDSLSAAGKLKPYRAWIRYSSEQLEIRAGLQKINFGSASMLRPLMWFDQMDPRDPLQLTDGVLGVLGRYYFLNNANIWLWFLYGNNSQKGWEIIPTNKKIPEFGGRVQIPVGRGEAALSYHHRMADSRGMEGEIDPYERIPENRIGLDARWDLKAGIWIESSLTHKSEPVGLLTNSLLINAGADYTFAAGNGIYIAFEQLFASASEELFTFSAASNYSLLSASYPIGLFDRLSAMIYYSWNDGNLYNFITWQKQLDNIIFYVMAYSNPDTYRLPARTTYENIFAGKGIQVMFVFNH